MWEVVMIADSLTRACLTSFAPQFLVEDLAGAIAYYRDKLGFSFGEAYDGFYAVGTRNGFELHLKEAPKFPGEREHRRAHEHLDAYAGVDDIDAFYGECRARGAVIIKPLARRPWGAKDFYVEGPEGYIIAFGGT
jgi:catechol 2,3-dioxygenase-like lactoylglutathione lyase family enzyme